jgi:hypothetical protein
MGWDFNPLWRTVKEVVDEVTEDTKRVVAFKLVGSTLWTVELVKSEKLIFCYLIRRSARLDRRRQR